jgi:hypothetical protein
MRRQQLANVLDMLPEQNQILTKYLISFLVRVSSYASDNLMTAANLATVRLSRSSWAFTFLLPLCLFLSRSGAHRRLWHQVFAPNLIRPPGDDLGALVEYTPHSNRTMETLILHYDELLAVRPQQILYSMPCREQTLMTSCAHVSPQKFPDPAPVSTPPAEIHQKSGWNHMKILPQGWKPNSTPAAQPAAATATATNATTNAPLPTGPPPPLPPHPTASYSSTPPPLPPYNAAAAAYTPLPTGPPPPLPPAPHNSTSSSLNGQQPPQPLPRPAQQSYYGAQAASSSGPYQTRSMTVPHGGGGGGGSGSEILPRRPAPQRPPPAQPSPTLPAGLPPIPAGSGLGRAQLTGSDPAAATPASPNQGRPLPMRQPEGDAAGKKWPPLAGSGTQDPSNTYPPAQSPLATSSLDDPSIPRRGARVMKKGKCKLVCVCAVVCACAVVRVWV